MDVLVLGSGISGLSCAIKLKEAGFEQVRILARDFPPNTTSDVAGGLWFPYKAEPIHRIIAWSKSTFQELRKLQKEFPESGITNTDFFQYFHKEIEHDAWWASAVEEYRIIGKNEIPSPFRGGYFAKVLVAEPHIHLPFLMQRFREMGGIIEHGEVTNLNDVVQEQRIVINCLGLEAGSILSDEKVYPIRGQILRVKNPGISRSMTIETNDEQSELATYTIARSEDVILGGVAMVNNWDTHIDMELVEGILERCSEIEPALKGAEVLGHKAGLRPGRTEIRLELEHCSKTSGIIHNYGHGGSGYTVNWGCAEEVVSLAALFAKNLY